MIRRTLLLLCACYTAMSGAATLDLSEADNGRAIPLHVGDLLHIRLTENATTGYRWDLESAPGDVIEPLGDAGDYPPGGTGSGGRVTFTFRARQAGQGELRLRHWRRWLGESSVTRRFRLQLHVSPAPYGP